MLSIAAFIGIICTSYLFGNCILFRIRHNNLYHAIVKLAVGLSINAYVIFTLGLFKILYSHVVIGILLCELAVGVLFFFRSGSSLPRGSIKSVLATAVTAALVLNVLLHTIGSLAPVVSTDALIYHFTLPKIYIANHTVIDRPDVLNATYPQFAEMLITMGMLVYSDITAKLLHLLFYILTLVVLYMFTREYTRNTFSALLAPLFFSLSPSINRIVGYGIIEFYMIFFIITAVYTLFLYYNKKQSYLAWLCFYFLGCAVSIKYISLIAAGICFVVYVLMECITVKKYRNIVITGIILTVAGTPFYIRNYRNTGNPFFPFYSKRIDVRYEKKELTADPDIRALTEKNINVNSAITEHFSRLGGKEKSLLKFLWFPYDISINFQKYDFWKYAIGPFFFIFLILIIPLLKTHKDFRFIFLIIILYTAAIYLKAPRGRYLLPIHTLICVGGAVALYTFLPKYRAAQVLIGGILGFCVLTNTALLFGQHCLRLPVVFGLQTKDDYLDKKFYAYGRFYPAVQWVNAHLKNERKILALIHEIYYFDVNVFVGFSSHLHRFELPYYKIKSADDFLAQLRLDGYRYIIFNQRFSWRYDHRLHGYVKKLAAAGKLLPEKDFGKNIIYRIKDS